MNPGLYRLVVDWSSSEPDLAKPQAGCMRDVQPCAGYEGLREQLQAVAAQGWETLIVFTGTPERYAAGPSGCERAGTQPRSRPPTDYEAFGMFIEKVQDLVVDTKAKVRYWSPWNEPNHPFGLSTQRSKCSAKAKALSPGVYAKLATTLQEHLKPGQDLVLGELAGLLQRKPKYVDVPTFIRRLPTELVCAAPIFTQHGYVGGPDPVDEVDDALKTHQCPRGHQIWMTETGAGGTRRGQERGSSETRACRILHKRLQRWYEDPRVTAAFQYTLREDDRFPTGLVSVDLQKAYPTLAAWTAWGERDSPEAEPPRATCEV